MSKRYRLLKDLPDAKAGTILSLGGYEKDLYMYSGILDDGQEASWYVKSTVENNPEWFEEIHQPKEELKEPELIPFKDFAKHCPRYSEIEVNKMMEDAFNGGQQIYQINVGEKSSAFKLTPKYPTFQDYLSSIKH